MADANLARLIGFHLRFIAIRDGIPLASSSCKDSEEGFMGAIDPIAFGPAIPNMVLAFGSSVALWAPLLGLFCAAALGVWYALPRQPAPRGTLRVVPAGAAS